MKKIFFVIPVYNVEKYLKRCVDSVLTQTYPGVELILIDDGSADNCPAICDGYAEEYDSVHVIHKPNGGLSSARNAGISYVMEIAKATDYITFLDSDDFVHPRFSEKMLAICEENDCGVAQCDYEKGANDYFTDSDSEGVSVSTSSEALLGYKLKSQSCAKVYRISVIGSVRFPIGMLNEDEFTTYRFVYEADKIGFTDEKLYYYFQHDTGIMKHIALKLKDSPHKYDYLEAYADRIRFFEDKNELMQIKRTHEKICTDIILRYTEQMQLKKAERDIDCINGTYKKIYDDNFSIMITGKTMPVKRRLMYYAFRIFPYSAVLASGIFTLRK